MKLYLSFCVSIFCLVLAVSCGDETTPPASSSGTDAGTGITGLDSATSGQDGTVGSDGSTGITGSTGTGICTPGDKVCEGNDLKICNVSGTTYDTTPCPYGCVNSACKTECEPNLSVCEDGTTLKSCDATGNIKITPCDHACVDGACVVPPKICEPDTQFCDGTGANLLTCSATGTETTSSTPCSYGCGGDPAVCLDPVCATGQTRCSPDDKNVVQLCASDQKSWVDATNTCSDGCEEVDDGNGGIKAQCIVLACAPSEESCGPEGIMKCTQDGKALELYTPCKVECLELADGGVQCAKCAVGLTQCNGAVVEQCNDQLEGFEQKKICTDLEVCSGGACVPVLLLEDDKGEWENYMLIVQAFVSCFKKTIVGTCLPIDTQGLSAGIESDKLKDWFCSDKVTKDDFKDADDYDVANDIIGCGWTNLDDFRIEGGEILAGKKDVQCVAYSTDYNWWQPADVNGKEIIVDECSKFD